MLKHALLARVPFHWELRRHVGYVGNPHLSCLAQRANCVAIVRQEQLRCLAEHGVHGQFESVIEHSGEERAKESWRFLEAGVCIHFNQGKSEILVDDEVIANELEAVLPEG